MLEPGKDYSSASPAVVEGTGPIGARLPHPMGISVAFYRCCVVHLRTSRSMPSQGKRRSDAVDGPVKRFRVSRACDQCRSERSKCDGNQPQCAPCFEAKRACTYTSNPRKRGLPPGYIRTIELALALVFQQSPEIEASLISRLGQPDTVLLARDSKESNRLHKNWRKTKFCRSLNKALTGDLADLEDEKALSSGGEDSDADVPVNPAGEETSTVGAHANMEFQLPPPLPPPSGSSPEMQRLKTVSELTPLPPNSWHLIETYTTYTQCWLPISEKLDMLKLSYSYPAPGLALSHTMPDSGHHAEMWSIFALGAVQDAARRPGDRDALTTLTPKRLYTITQSLIPDELGKFHLGHVKALLNLALFNTSLSLYNAAWLLVGAASRVVLTVEESPGAIGTRRPHVLASCFMLDSLLALILNRRPYLETEDIGRAGRIEEDGLEEWQPWTGDIGLGNKHLSQSPSLALSSFNNLLEVLDILVLTTRQLNTKTPSDGPARRFERWKASLSSKFDFVRIDSAVVPLTPCAVFLQLASFATSFALAPSPAWLQRIFELLEPFRFSFANLPITLTCLLENVKRVAGSVQLEQPTRSRINDLVATFKQAHSIAVGMNTPSIPADSPLRISTMNQPKPMQPSPQPLLPQVNEAVPSRHRSRAMRPSLIDDLLPDMSNNQPRQVQSIQPFDPNAVDTDFTSPGFDTYDASISGDLDSFFDELASLHGARKLENQSQFMENLGFAPEISMADLLATQSGQFMPMNPGFGADHDGGPIQFPLNDYYDVDRGRAGG